MVRVFAAIAAVAAAAVVVPAAPHGVDAYLRDVIGLSNGELKRVRAGDAVATSLDGHDGREIVTFGAIRITKAPDGVLAYITSVDGLRRGAAVEQLGLINSPPRPEDFAAFSLHPQSVQSLTQCRIGDCPMQWPGWAVARLTAGGPTTPPDVSAATTIAHSVALEILRVYQRGGHRALAPYEDRRPPTHPSAEYTRLLASAQYMPAPLAAVRHALHVYPLQPTTGVRDQFFWTVMDYGMKPTFRLSHMQIATGPAIDDPSGVVSGAAATLQLLSTHYYSSTLEWHFVARDPDTPSAAFLFHLSRSFAPGLTGIRGRLSRFTVRSRSEDGIKAYLADTRRHLEGGR